MDGTIATTRDWTGPSSGSSRTGGAGTSASSSSRPGSTIRRPPQEETARSGLIKNTREYPIVRALEPAIQAGILVVTGNNNTATENTLPPVEYLSVGAYHDSGHADPRFHRENPDEPWGRNSDGHLRPDLLAPRYFVPNHRTPEGELAYFGGTSSASAQVAALCALLFARFPQADAQTIKYALIRSGDPLPGSRRPGVRVNAARAIQLLTDGSVRPPWPRIPPPVTVTDPNSSLQSQDAIERALAVSALAWHPELFRPKDGERLRQVFWRLLRDDSPNVRKAAASALAGPESKEERRQLWETLHHEPDMGVRGQLAQRAPGRCEGRFPGRLDSSRDRPELVGAMVCGQGAAGSSSGCTTTRLCDRPGGDREESPAGPRLVSKEKAVQMNASPMRCSYQLPVGLISSLMDD